LLVSAVEEDNNITYHSFSIDTKDFIPTQR
jgi:hypothetical protein